MVNAFIKRNIFLILLYTADSLMSNVDSFDIGQISSKFVQNSTLTVISIAKIFLI